MITEFRDAASRETLAVYLHEVILGEMAIWTVLLEAFVPLLDSVLGVLGVIGEEVNIFFRQPVPRLLQSEALSEIVFKLEN